MHCVKVVSYILYLHILHVYIHAYCTYTYIRAHFIFICTHTCTYLAVYTYVLLVLIIRNKRHFYNPLIIKRSFIPTISVTRLNSSGTTSKLLFLFFVLDFYQNSCPRFLSEFITLFKLFGSLFLITSLLVFIRVSKYALHYIFFS